MRTLFALVLTTAVGGLALAHPSDDETLGHYLAKCQYAFAGEVVSEPVKVERIEDDARKLVRKGQVIYTCRIKVVDQFQYPHPPLPKDIMICVVRWPDEKDESPAGLKKGEKCIFFLDWVFTSIGGRSSAWLTVDPWFGVQRYNGPMAAMLKKQGKRKDPAN